MDARREKISREKPTLGPYMKQAPSCVSFFIHHRQGLQDESMQFQQTGLVPSNDPLAELKSQVG